MFSVKQNHHSVCNTYTSGTISGLTLGLSGNVIYYKPILNPRQSRRELLHQRTFREAGRLSGTKTCILFSQDVDPKYIRSNASPETSV